MPDPGNAEATLIQAAYQDAVKGQFGSLFVNLQHMPVNNMTERQCVDTFKNGMKLAKRARDLALNALAAADTTAASAPKKIGLRSKKAKTA